MKQYHSRERVYSLGADGLPHRLRYAVGDEIPEQEARRQGLIADEIKQAAPAANKARARAADKARTTSTKEP